MDLIGNVSRMPSHQLPDHGYSGMVEEPAIYGLTSPAMPWVDWPDPGPHHTIDIALDAAGQADALVQYNAYKKVYDSQENVRRAVINALTVAVPQATDGWQEEELGYETTGQRTALWPSLRVYAVYTED